ncbi:MAG TPA: hypothetical protein VFB38_27310 [Chthonomonadaceae bacterium]|nr:hypothetical protein [Chthonomonadaceae bacterium]
MNGMLSARIARYDPCYLDRIEERLAHYAGGARQLAALEAQVCAPADSLQALTRQYQALRRLGEICRAVESELADYQEIAYRAECGADGEAILREEINWRAPVRDVLDERFAYVRAFFDGGILTLESQAGVTS